MAFALVGEVVRPKRFAGVFGASPAIALANLSLVVAVEGVAKAATESRAMIGGAVALAAACAVGRIALGRYKALGGSAVIIAVWVAVAAAAAVWVY